MDACFYCLSESEFDPCPACQEMLVGRVLAIQADTVNGHPVFYGPRCWVKHALLRKMLSYDRGFAEVIIATGYTFIPPDVWKTLGIPSSGEEALTRGYKVRGAFNG